MKMIFIQLKNKVLYFINFLFWRFHCKEFEKLNLSNLKLKISVLKFQNEYINFITIIIIYLLIDFYYFIYLLIIYFFIDLLFIYLKCY